MKGVGGLAGVRIADARRLPPTAILQYHFTNLGLINPYFGVSINCPSFSNRKTMGSSKSFNPKNNTGLTLQVGGYIMIARHWSINRDVKKAFLGANVSVNDGVIREKVKIDPGAHRHQRNLPVPKPSNFCSSHREMVLQQ